MHPGINLLFFHGIQNLAKLFLAALIIILGSHSLEAVKFLIIEIEVFAIEALLAVCMPTSTTALAATMVMMVVMLLNNSAFLAKSLYQEESRQHNQQN